MSMDDVYENLKSLEQGLEQFNEHLRNHFAEVMQAHDHLQPEWDDEMRREYDITWQPMQDSMEEYIHQIGPNYVGYLVQQLHHLRAYLYGHGS